MQSKLDKLIVDDTVITQFLQQYVEYNVLSLERRALRISEESEQWTNSERQLINNILVKCAYWKNAPFSEKDDSSLSLFFQNKFQSLSQTYSSRWKPYSESIASILKLTHHELEHNIHYIDTYCRTFTQLFRLYERICSLNTKERVSLDFIHKKTKRLQLQLHKRRQVLYQYYQLDTFFEEEDEHAIQLSPTVYMHYEKRIQQLLQEPMFLTEQEFQDISNLQLKFHRYKSRTTIHKKNK